MIRCKNDNEIQRFLSQLSGAKTKSVDLNSQRHTNEIGNLSSVRYGTKVKFTRCTFTHVNRIRASKYPTANLDPNKIL